jgi:hypothetical protein
LAAENSHKINKENSLSSVNLSFFFSMDEGTPVARILEVLAAHPEGLAQADLQRAVGGSLEELALGINDLLQNGRIELSRKGGTNFYKYIDPDLAAKFKGLTAEERLIYQLIEAEKDMGLWTRDMKYKSNLQQTQINKTKNPPNTSFQQRHP